MINAKKVTFIIILSILAFILPENGQAASSAAINVTVTIQNISVSASGPIAFGTVTASSAAVAADSSHVVNDGNVTETFSLSLADPGSWTAVQAAPGADTYALSAQFNSDKPLVGEYVYADHALSTTPVASSATKFAGDQDGLDVAASGIVYLWFKFEAPTSSSVYTQQTIVVTVTAAAS